MQPCLVLWSIDVERSVLRACYKNLFLKRLCSAGGSVKRYSRYGKPYGGSSKKLKTELAQDPAIPFLDIYLNEICVLKRYFHMHAHGSIDGSNPSVYQKMNG